MALDMFKFLLISALSSYGIALLCFILEMLIGSSVGPQNRFLDYAFLGPTFAVPVSLGLVLGYLTGLRVPRLSSRLVFVVPMALAVYEVATWVTSRYPGPPLLAEIAANFLTSDCSSSECGEELVITAPLLSSLAFAVGSELRYFLFSRARKLPHPVR